MKVTKEKVEKSQAFLTIEMEPAEVEEALQEAYSHLVKRANIPGFRKGKAPRAILERYIGKESLIEDAIEHMLPEAYEKAIAEQKLEAVARPEIQIVQKEPLIFKATVPLVPTVKLGDYHQLSLTPEPVKVTDDDVNALIEQLRHQHATWEPAERAVELGDLLVLDVDSTIENKPFINQKGVQYQVIQGLALPLTGFAEQLVGMKQGEEKEFKLQIPPDYPRGELAGKEASFKVKVIEIKQEKLSELNDEFAAQVDPEFKTLDALRERVSEQLRNRVDERAKADFEEKVLEEVANLSQVEYPPVLADMEIEQLLNQQSRRLQMGGVGLDDYLKSVKKTADELRAELRPLATKRVIRSFVLGKVAEEEKIEISDAEIDAEIENMAKSAGDKQDELRKSLNDPRTRESIKQILLTRKTVQKLVEIAKSPKTENQVKKEGEA